MKIFFIFLAILLFVVYILATREERKARAKYEPKGKVDEYWSGKERRRVERIEARLDVKYRLIISPKMKITASSKNLSKDGICILAQEILPKDSMIAIEIFIPNIRESIHAKGAVSWSKDMGQLDADGKRTFSTGIKFVEINDKEKMSLINYINTLSLKRG